LPNCACTPFWPKGPKAMAVIVASPLTAASFAPFGDVLDVAGRPDKLINQGLCGRFHDRARLDFGPDGRAGISLFDARPRALPYLLEMVERHPDGSQAFIPMHEHPFLVIVADQMRAAHPARPAPLSQTARRGSIFTAISGMGC
jgi:ureidoglycolate hydrolase